jgi:hypothetical protein
MIVWLASYPRSGNTYFRMLLHHLHGLKTYSVYDDPLLERMDGSADAVGHEKLPGSIDELDSHETVYLVKTHHLPRDERPAIQIVRDGRDALVSYAKFMQSFENPFVSMGWLNRAVRSLTGWKEDAAILQGLILSSGGDFGSWAENVVAWRSRSAQTGLVRYEDLVADPQGEVCRVLKELGISGYGRGAAADVPDFAKLNRLWPQFFRQGHSGTWRSVMTPRLERLFWKNHRQGMEKLGYQ